MTNDQASESGNTGMVSGAVNLTINLPEGVQITTVDTSQPVQPEVIPAASVVVPGTIVPFAGRTEPADNWLLCDGRAVEQLEYPTLYAVIGNDYSPVASNTTFNLPDLRGRFPLGLDNMGGNSADSVTAAEADEIGKGGGAETHTLTEDEMPSHDHDPSGSGSDLEFMVKNRSSGGRFYHGTASESHTGIIGSSDETAEDGEDEPHNNMPPYLSLNYLIKT